MPLAVAAIHFLNPAPLMWDMEHAPRSLELAKRYELRYMQPSQCATELHSGAAGLGLIPIASLSSHLAIVPGCAIASLGEVRSILLLVKNPARLSASEALGQVRNVAADAASRSSVAYAHVIFQRFYGVTPSFQERPADPLAMLADADAALLIGDPALIARERRAHIDTEIDAAFGAPLLWLDVAALWREHTGLPWVAAVWAARPEALEAAGIDAAQLVADLVTSRDHGLAHIEDLVREWTPRLPLPPETIHTYLTENIHYVLDDACVETIRVFRHLAFQVGALPPLPQLHMLG